MNKEMKTKLEILNDWVNQIISDCYDLQQDLNDTQDYLESMLEDDEND